MEIIPADSKEAWHYTGEGGYRGIIRKITVNKNVDVFGFYEIVIPPHSISIDHYHEHFVEVFYLQTPMRIKINGKEFNLAAGTIVVLNPGDRHEEYAGEEEVRYLVFKLPDVKGDKIITAK